MEQLLCLASSLKLRWGGNLVFLLGHASGSLFEVRPFQILDELPPRVDEPQLSAMGESVIFDGIVHGEFLLIPDHVHTSVGHVWGISDPQAHDIIAGLASM